MSIHNDYRKHGTEEQRQEWLQELKDEYRRQEAYDARWQRIATMRIDCQRIG